MQRYLPSCLLVICLLAIATLGGERGPGEYAGTVIYDQWDTCYIYSGSYVMYIAETEKETLRKYAGQSIVIDATEVVQPMNPGDGLITKFNVVGPAKGNDQLPEVDGLILTARQMLEKKYLVSFELGIKNTTTVMRSIDLGDIAPTLLGEKSGDDYFSPSDGRSDAKITRCSLANASQWYHKTRVTSKGVGGNDETLTKEFSVEVKGVNSPSKTFKLAPGKERLFVVTLRVPAGKYDFLFGYGGGFHEGKGSASNLISFSVNERGWPEPQSANAKATDTARPESSDFMNLLFGNRETATAVRIFHGI